MRVFSVRDILSSGVVIYDSYKHIWLRPQEKKARKALYSGDLSRAYFVGNDDGVLCHRYERFVKSTDYSFRVTEECGFCVEYFETLTEAVRMANAMHGFVLAMYYVFTDDIPF